MTVTLTRHPSRRLPSHLGDRVVRGLPADPVRPVLPRSAAPTRRVRHLVRDGLAVIAFSAGASTLLAGVLVLLTRVAG